MSSSSACNLKYLITEIQTAVLWQREPLPRKIHRHPDSEPRTTDPHEIHLHQFISEAIGLGGRRSTSPSTPSPTSPSDKRSAIWCEMRTCTITSSPPRRCWKSSYYDRFPENSGPSCRTSGSPICASRPTQTVPVLEDWLRESTCTLPPPLSDPQNSSDQADR